MLCCCIVITFNLLETFCLNEVIANRREGEHLVFAQLGEEYFATVAEDTCEHTNLSALFWRYEITLNVRWSSKRLFFLQTMNPSVWQ